MDHVFMVFGAIGAEGVCKTNTGTREEVRKHARSILVRLIGLQNRHKNFRMSMSLYVNDKDQENGWKASGSVILSGSTQIDKIEEALNTLLAE